MPLWNWFIDIAGAIRAVTYTGPRPRPVSQLTRLNWRVSAVVDRTGVGRDVSYRLSEGWRTGSSAGGRRYFVLRSDQAEPMAEVTSLDEGIRIANSAAGQRSTRLTSWAILF